MFVLKSLVAFLAFGLVLSLPHGSHNARSDVFHHHVRNRAIKGRSCKPGPPKNGTSVAPLPSATPQNLNAHASSSVEHSSSATRTASSSAHSASETKPPSQPAQPASISPHGSFAALAPLSFKQGWSTAPSSDDPLPLSDSTFRPHNVLNGLPWHYGNAPDGQRSIVVEYPKDSYNFQHEPHGGISWYGPGPSNVDITKAKEVVFGYTAMFEDGFDFVKGGKMFGLYTGNSESAGIGCSGGHRGNECSSIRLMWRKDGAMEAYTYLPSSFSANERVCDIPPFSECNPTYGASVGRGAAYFTPGVPMSVAMRVRLNDENQSNGGFEIYANGKSVIKADGLVLRDSGAGLFRGVMAQSFFGGSTPDFASSKDQTAYYRDLTISITEYL